MANHSIFQPIESIIKRAEPQASCRILNRGPDICSSVGSWKRERRDGLILHLQDAQLGLLLPDPQATGHIFVQCAHDRLRSRTGVRNRRKALALQTKQSSSPRSSPKAVIAILAKGPNELIGQTFSGAVMMNATV